MKTNKTLYAILAFGPLAMLIPVFVLMGMMFAEILEHPGRYADDAMPPQFPMMIIVSTIVGLVAMVGLIMYIMHITRNRHIPDNSRTMWILLLVFAGTIGMAVYYFTWIRKEDELNAKAEAEAQSRGF